MRDRPWPALFVSLGLALLVAAAVEGCGVDQVSTVEGVVISVQSESPGSVQGFTLRLSDGTVLELVIDGSIDFGHGGFPASHLREHQALGEAVRVTYRTEGSGPDERLVVVRLEDTG